MNVLLTHRPGGAYGHISEAWLNAFKATGHKVARWDGELSSWLAFRPAVYLGCSGHRQPIPHGQQRGGCRLAIHVNPHGPVNTGVNEPLVGLQWVAAQRPQVVFGYGFAHQAELWSGWTADYGIPWCPLPTAGDATAFYPRDSARDLDLCYIGGYWPYKAQVLDSYLLPLRADGLIIYGWGNWPPDEYGPGSSGQPADGDVPLLLARTKVGPCISEPHTHRFGIDLPERVFKVALSGALAVHDPAYHLGMVLASVPVGHTPADYIELCQQWLAASDDDRAARAAQQRQEVLAGHTYFHRLARLLHALGFSPADGAGLAPYWPV